jgi:hypothetical protein
MRHEEVLVERSRSTAHEAEGGGWDEIGGDSKVLSWEIKPGMKD